MPPRHFLIVTFAACLTAPAAAQEGGPLGLVLPVGARAAAMGNAWVAGRDEYVVFSNPAQVNTTTGLGITGGTFGGGSRTLATAGGATVGRVTLGWGMHLVDFSTPRSNAAYPYSAATATRSGDADLLSFVGVVSGQMTWKGFRIGLAGKYAEDVAPQESPTSSVLVVPTRGSVVVGDVGVSRPLWTGTAAFAVQNIGQPYLLGGGRFPVPTQAALGWSALKQFGPVDYGVATQVLARRHGWVSPAAGVEVAWGWIEGYTIAGRVGARRPESSEERPVGLGASFTADRLNVDYGTSFFSGGALAHRLTVRWR